jgi:hypothetical protein
MRKKNIEPTIESIVKKYLIPEKMARALLSQKSLREQPDNEVFPFRE